MFATSQLRRAAGLESPAMPTAGWAGDLTPRSPSLARCFLQHCCTTKLFAMGQPLSASPARHQRALPARNHPPGSGVGKLS